MLIGRFYLPVYRTVQFVGIAAFHNRVSDPLIGGTYMTVRFQICSDAGDI